MVIDESPARSRRTTWNAVIGPVRNTKRDICHQRGISDYPSKTISITSACLKSNYFYAMFCKRAAGFRQGQHGQLRVRAGLSQRGARGYYRHGVLPKGTAAKCPKRSSRWNMGAFSWAPASGSMLFPMILTEGCRTLRQVEYAGSLREARPIISSASIWRPRRMARADNAVICVVKLADMENGAYLKKLVYLRSYHGKRLDALAEEVRRTFSRFPRTTRIVFDHRGVGDAFPQFLAQPWIDPESGQRVSTVDTGGSSGRSSTMPCPSCAASRPVRRSISSWYPACAWHRNSVPLSCRSARGTPTA